MAKMFATESAQQVIDDAVQISGGLGVKRGHPVEQLYREVRALRIYEGATEVQKMIIARDLLKGMSYTAHLDSFARDNLPPSAQWPEFRFDLPGAALSGAPELRLRAARQAGDARPRRPCRAPLARTANGPTRSCSRRPTASPTCWCATWASCPATASCCAARTTR